MSTPAGDDVAGSARIVITLDDSGVVADAEELGQRIQRALDRTTRTIGRRIRSNIERDLRRAIQVRIEADLSRFYAQVQSLSTIANLNDLAVPVNPDMAGFVNAIRAHLAGEEVSIRVVPDLDDFDAQIRAHVAPTITVNANVDRDRFTQALAGLGSIAGRVAGILASGLGIAAIGIAAVGAAQGVIALTAALAPAVGIIAAAPAVILGYQAALGTLKLALDGVSEAFSAALTGDAEAFQKTLEKLSPAAQAAALEVRALKPAFDDLKASVQDAFFEQITGQITKTAQALQGPLQSGLTRISAAWGDAARGVLGYVQGTQGVANVRSILDATGLSVEGLSQTTNKLTAGILRVAASISNAFGAQFGSAISSAGQRFGEFLQEAGSSGQAVVWVRDAVAVFQQLGAIASNVGSILSGVFGAADSAGAGFLTRLEQITGQVAAFVNTDAAQSAIGNIFTTLATIGQQLGPILGEVVRQVGQIAPALVPILTTAGPAIQTLVAGLGGAASAALPQLTVAFQNMANAVVQLAPALAPTAAAVASLARSATDLLIPLAPLVSLLAQIVAPVVEFAAPVLVAAAATTALVKAFMLVRGALVVAQAAWLALNAAFVATPLGVIAAAVAGVALAVYLLYQRFQPVRDVVNAVGSALKTAFVGVVGFVTQVATSVSNFVTAIPGFFSALPGQIGGFFTAVGQTILNFFTGLPGIILGLLSMLGQTILTALTTAGTAILTFFTSLPGQIMAGLQALPALIGTVIGTAIGYLILTLTQLPGRVAGALSSLGSTIAGLFFSAMAAGRAAVSSGVSAVLTFFQQLPGRALGALSSLGSRLAGLFFSAWAAGRAAVSSGISSVVAFFQQLPGRAVSVLSSLPSRLGATLRSAGTSMLNAARTAGSNVVSFFTGLPGKIRGALSGAVSALVGVGRDLVRGLINGVKAMAGSVASAAKEVVSSAIDSAKSVLKISSPSKVFIQIGKDTGKGFVIGLTGSAAEIKRTTDKIAQDIRDAFKGKNTKLDDRLLKLVADGNKRLVGLANQRDAIAKKLADAQKFATDTAASALQGFSLQNLTQGGVNLFNITEGLDQAIGQVESFTKQIASLGKRGLRKDLLAQIVGLGPQQGAQLASFLSSQSTDTLKRINSLQKQLVGASNVLGKTAADGLFDAGKNASKGFLAGLKGQQKDIEKLMVDIALAMQKSIRKALGIKSPSVVFKKIGGLTGQGLNLGFVDSMREVLASARTAAGSIAQAVTGELSTLSNVVAGPVVQPAVGDLTRAGVVLPVNGRPALAGLGRGGASVTNNITVQAANDPEQTARVVMRRIALANLT
jgi:hypothetical protein